MNLKIRNGIKEKRPAALVGLLISVFVFYFVVKHFWPQHEEENPARTATQNGERVIRLTKEELARNGIMIEAPKKISRMNEVNTYGYWLDPEEIKFYAEEAKKPDLFDGEKYSFIQMQAPAGERMDPPPEKVTVHFNKEAPIEAELVVTSATASGTLYRFPKDLRRNVPTADLLPISFSNGEAKEGVAVPASAVIWLEGSPWVYVQKDAEHFARHAVTLAPISEDPELQNNIVVRGAQQILSEEFINEIGEDAE